MAKKPAPTTKTQTIPSGVLRVKGAGTVTDTPPEATDLSAPPAARLEAFIRAHGIKTQTGMEYQPDRNGHTALVVFDEFDDHADSPTYGIVLKTTLLERQGSTSTEMTDATVAAWLRQLAQP